MMCDCMPKAKNPRITVIYGNTIDVLLTHELERRACAAGVGLDVIRGLEPVASMRPAIERISAG
jgi:hypothetical protein